MNPERLERYLDGQGSPAERATFERDLARDPALAAQLALQRRIDAALGRTFAPPQGLAAAAPAARAARDAGGVHAWRGRMARPAAAAAAAVLCGVALGYALWRPAEPGGERVALLPAGAAEAGGAAGAGVGSEPGADAGVDAAAALPAAAVPHAVAEAPVLPDVASLYERLTGLAQGAGGEAGPFDPARLPGAGVDLSCELALRYDACFDVGAPACSLLGPYAAPEWPSATVFFGFCEDQGRTPSLLVVDDQTMRGCALAPDTGGLLPFYKEVNGLAVWEISTREQPVLLDAVRSCRE